MSLSGNNYTSVYLTVCLAYNIRHLFILEVLFVSVFLLQFYDYMFPYIESGSICLGYVSESVKGTRTDSYLSKIMTALN